MKPVFLDNPSLIKSCFLPVKSSTYDKVINKHLNVVDRVALGESAGGLPASLLLCVLTAGLFGFVILGSAIKQALVAGDIDADLLKEVVEEEVAARQSDTQPAALQDVFYEDFQELAKMRNEVQKSVVSETDNLISHNDYSRIVLWASDDRSQQIFVQNQALYLWAGDDRIQIMEPKIFLKYAGTVVGLEPGNEDKVSKFDTSILQLEKDEKCEKDLLEKKSALAKADALQEAKEAKEAASDAQLLYELSIISQRRLPEVAETTS